MDDLFDFPDEEQNVTGNTDAIFSVTQLTRKIRNLLEDRIGEVWVEGEISNLRNSLRGTITLPLRMRVRRSPVLCFGIKSASSPFL